MSSQVSAPTVAPVAPTVYLGVALVSAATLGLETVCMRIFSFTIWYHFAYLTINSALLGFSSAGAVLALFPSVFGRFGHSLMWLPCVVASVTAFAFLLIAARHPIDPQLLFESPWKFGGDLAVYYVGIALPFFLIGITIAVAMVRSAQCVARLYFADLLGAGIGVVVALPLMYLLEPPAAAVACICLLMFGAMCLGLQDRRRVMIALASLAIPAGFLVGWARERLEFTPANSTQVAQFMAQPDAFRLVYKGWNSVGRIDVYESVNRFSDWTYPQWTYDGNSPKVRPRERRAPPSYLMMGDAHTRSDIYKEVANGDNLAFLDSHLLRLPYLIMRKPDVLVVGAGGGGDVMNARRHHARSITAVELQPLVVRLLKNELAGWTGGIYGNGDVKAVAKEARSFLRGDPNSYDLIQFTAADTWAALNTGAYVLTESYLYTKEAYADYLDHLKPDGILCLLVWDGVQERGEYLQPANSRLVLGYLEVLRARGISNPARHLVIVGKREWYGYMFTVPMLKKSPFTPAELVAVREFAAQQGFEMLHDPEGSNQSSVLARLINASDEERNRMIDSSFYEITPTTDDRPFFFDIFRWRNLVNLDFSTWQKPAAGKVVLVLMLAQSLALACLCIVAPLLAGGRAGIRDRAVRYPFLFYFLAIGVAYMFIEISMIQKFVVFLGYPAYAFATVVFSMLASSGLGSYLTSRLDVHPRRLVAGCAAVIACLLLAYGAAMPQVFSALLDAAYAVKVTVTVLLLLPLGFVMGMFMPIGLIRAVEMSKRVGAWAWGLNGVGGVLGTVLAIMIAMSQGFRFVAYLSIAIYGFAAAAMWYLWSRGFVQSTRATQPAAVSTSG